MDIDTHNELETKAFETKSSIPLDLVSGLFETIFAVLRRNDNAQDQNRPRRTVGFDGMHSPNRRLVAGKDIAIDGRLSEGAPADRGLGLQYNYGRVFLQFKLISNHL